jgi:phosphohistidine phosphatase
MELILWRHAEAEEGIPDATRALTVKGHKQARKSAEWLNRNLPGSCKILSSPTRRTVQTADALGRKFTIHSGLGPHATAQEILSITGWPNANDPVLVVGHQPTLGQIAALLLAGSEQDWSIRKSNVWWFAQRDRGDDTANYLRAMMAPDLSGQ